MLKKLMKYELLVFEKKIVWFYLFFIIFSIVAGFVPDYMILNFDATVAQPFNEILYLAYLFVVYYAAMSPLIIGFTIFKDMMFSDSAHLVRTLPVKESAFVICHIAVTYIVTAVNSIVIWLGLSISLSDDSYVSALSSSFVQTIRGIEDDVRVKPMILLLIVSFVLLIIMFSIATELCVLFINGCLDRREKRSKIIIMIETALLVCVMLILLVREDIYDTLIVYFPVFAVLTVAESAVITKINHTCYNLR